MIGAILIIGIVLFLAYMWSPRGMVLVTQGSVLVYATEVDALTPNTKEIAILSAGQSVPVTKCIDEKAYFLHKVRLPDKRLGFILQGEYTLMRNGEQAFCP